MPGPLGLASWGGLAFCRLYALATLACRLNPEWGVTFKSLLVQRVTASNARQFSTRYPIKDILTIYSAVFVAFLPIGIDIYDIVDDDVVLVFHCCSATIVLKA